MHKIYASTDSTSDSVPLPSMQWGSTESSGQDNSEISRDERKQRLNALVNYVRKVGPGWVPGLTPIVRDPGGWIARQVDFFDFGALGDLDNPATSGDGDFAAMIKPVQQMMSEPDPEQGKAIWFSPQYHHKGFMPTHDALIGGVNLRHRVWDDRLQFDMHPFYGQNWLHPSGYWGTEMAVSFGAHALAMQNHVPEGTTGFHQWGTLTLRYTNGDHELMDSNNHGLDMRGEFHFTDRVSLNAGVRRDDQNNPDNYLLLRWKKPLN